MSEYYDKLAKAIASIDFDAIHNAINNSYKLGEKILEAYNVFDEWWQTTGPKICQVIENINIPEYSEQKKKELVANYKKWGEFGWTSNPISKFNSFSKLPVSKEDADNQMRKYCTPENVAEIKNRLVAKGVDNNDLEEALFCFEHGRYKASSLIVFGLIDHELISKGFRSAPKENKSEGKYKLGLSAVCEYRKQNKKDYDKSFLYANLYFLNIMETLMTLFKDTDNFTDEPDIINRNFISHGMSKRAVDEIDCFKAWSALFSLVVLLPILEEIKE